MRSGRAAMLLALFLAACGGNGPPKHPAVEVSPRQASVTVKTTGDVTIDFTGTASIQRIVSDAPSVAAGLRFLSITLDKPLKSGSVEFRAGFNLFGFAGGGRYAIAARGASPPGGLISIAFLELTGKARAPSESFKVPSEPCSLTVKGRGDGGELVCPDLRSDSGKSVALSFTWASA